MIQSPAGSRTTRTSRTRPPIHLGTYLPQSRDERERTIVCEDRRLQRFLKRPEVQAHLARHLNVSFRKLAEAATGPAHIAHDALARHSFVVGATGSGKSRALWRLLTEQLRAGCSAVVLDPKGETTDYLLSWAVTAKLPPQSVVVIDPRPGYGPPVLNPLATDLPLPQAVADFVDLLAQSTTSWGPRLADMLTNACLVVGSHGGSLFEVARLLTNEAYREALLRQSVKPRDPVAYAEAHQYFLEEFGAWGKSERTGAVSPAMNKIRSLLQSSFLLPLLCGTKPSLELATLWQKPRLILVRLDRPSLGDDGTRLLAGMVVNLLFRTALRTAGPVPVVLAIDELPQVERFVGGAIADIVTVARSQGLRCMLAAQHLDQLSERLRSTVLANCAVSVFFRLGHADARLAAGSLAVGAEARVTRLTVSVDKEDRKSGAPECAEWRGEIRDPFGRALRLHPGAWDAVGWLTTSGAQALERVQRICAATGVSRLYVERPDTGDPVELNHYIAGLNPSEYQITGPKLELIVRFPRPRITAVERSGESEAVRSWTHHLEYLPVQQAALRLAGQPPQIIRVVDVPDLRVSDRERAAFVRASIATNGQSTEEAAAVLQARRDQVARVAGGRSPANEADDGSL
jgi:hypothetical protein